MSHYTTSRKKKRSFYWYAYTFLFTVGYYYYHFSISWVGMSCKQFHLRFTYDRCQPHYSYAACLMAMNMHLLCELFSFGYCQRMRDNLNSVVLYLTYDLFHKKKLEKSVIEHVNLWYLPEGNNNYWLLTELYAII